MLIGQAGSDCLTGFKVNALPSGLAHGYLVVDVNGHSFPIGKVVTRSHVLAQLQRSRTKSPNGSLLSAENNLLNQAVPWRETAPWWTGSLKAVWT